MLFLLFDVEAIFLFPWAVVYRELRLFAFFEMLIFIAVILAGFAGKFFIFSSAVESGLLGLTLIGVGTTVVSFYYYLWVIVEMYMKDPVEGFEETKIQPATGIALAVAVTITLYLGGLPARVLEWASQSGLLD